jgi:exonuclease SbcD
LRILHTSDWHLGKKLYKKDRTPEHEAFLNWLSDSLKTQKIDVLVIAGDILDTPIPTTDSLSLLFRFLKELEVHKENLKKVFILAGNHDSAKLLESPRPFLDDDFIKVVGTLNAPENLDEESLETWRQQYSVTLEGEGKNYNFCMLPFFRTREILAMPWVDSIKEETPEIEQDDLILASLTEWNKAILKKEHQNILISHHVFGSFMASGSEQGVALSGIDSLPLSLYEGFDLLLLGHIHKKQILRKSPPALYCGSPIPLRFSESNEKYVYILEQNRETEEWDLTEQLIPCARPLVRVESNYENYKEDIKKALEKYPLKENPLNAFLELTLKMESPTSGLLDEIREYLSDQPVELINYFSTIDRADDSGPRLNVDTVTSKSTPELFELYLDSFDLNSEKRELLTKSFRKLVQTQQDDLGGAQ